jgi:hypothetical protein
MLRKLILAVAVLALPPVATVPATTESVTIEVVNHIHYNGKTLPIHFTVISRGMGNRIGEADIDAGQTINVRGSCFYWGAYGIEGHPTRQVPSQGFSIDVRPLRDCKMHGVSYGYAAIELIGRIDHRQEVISGAHYDRWLDFGITARRINYTGCPPS